MLLTREQIRRAFELLALELEPRSPRVELALVGGAPLALLYDARDTTKDVDVVIVGGADGAEVRGAARRVAAALHLPEDWLNDGAKGFVHGYSPGDVILETPSLIVRSLAVPQLLAMKLSAWRDDVDIADAGLLLSKLTGDSETIWASVAPFVVPGRELKARYAFLDLWEASRESA